MVRRREKRGAEKRTKGVRRREQKGCGEEKLYFGATVLMSHFGLIQVERTDKIGEVRECRP